jgi:hypothetical protein
MGGARWTVLRWAIAANLNSADLAALFRGNPSDVSLKHHRRSSNHIRSLKCPDANIRPPTFSELELLQRAGEQGGKQENAQTPKMRLNVSCRCNSGLEGESHRLSNHAIVNSVPVRVFSAVEGRVYRRGPWSRT